MRQGAVDVCEKKTEDITTTYYIGHKDVVSYKLTRSYDCGSKITVTLINYGDS